MFVCCYHRRDHHRYCACIGRFITVLATTSLLSLSLIARKGIFHHLFAALGGCSCEPTAAAVAIGNVINSAHTSNEAIVYRAARFLSIAEQYSCQINNEHAVTAATVKKPLGFCSSTRLTML